MGRPLCHSVSDVLCPIQCTIVQSTSTFWAAHLLSYLLSWPWLFWLTTFLKFTWRSTKILVFVFLIFFSPWITANSGSLSQSAILHLVRGTWLQFSCSSVKIHLIAFRPILRGLLWIFLSHNVTCNFDKQTFYMFLSYWSNELMFPKAFPSTIEPDKSRALLLLLLLIIKMNKEEKITNDGALWHAFRDCLLGWPFLPRNSCKLIQLHCNSILVTVHLTHLHP